MQNIKGLFKNEIIRKVLIFFNENPHSIDTARGISVWVGSNYESVQKALNKLTKEGILINHKAVSTNAYSYTTDRKVLKEIEKNIKKLKPATHKF